MALKMSHVGAQVSVLLHYVVIFINGKKYTFEPLFPKRLIVKVYKLVVIRNSGTCFADVFVELLLRSAAPSTWTTLAALSSSHVLY